jgi:hypothetical protein
MPISKNNTNIDTQSEIKGGWQQGVQRQVYRHQDLSHLTRAANALDRQADEQMWNGIDTIYNTIKRGVHDFSLSALEEEQQGNVDSFISSREGKREGDEAFIKAAQLKKARDSLISQMGPAALPEMFQGLDEAYKREMATYERAKDQGVMSIAEFEARILETTKKHVRRLPNMGDEFMAAANRILKINGVYGLKDTVDRSAEEEDKQRREQEKRLMNVADRIGLAYDILNPDFSSLNIAVQKRQAELSRHKRMQEFSEEGNILDEQQRRLFAKEGGTQFVNGNLTEFQSSMLDYVQREPDYAKFKRGMSDMATQMLNKASGWLRSQGLINTPEGKEMYDSLESSIRATVSSMEAFSSGEDAVKYATTQLEGLRVAQETNIRKRYDLATLDLLNKISPTYMETYLVNKPENREMLFSITDALLSQSMGSTTLKNGLTTYTMSGDAPDSAVAFTAVLSSGNEEQIGTAVKTMKQLITRQRGDSPASALKFMDSQIKMLLDPQTTQAFKDRPIGVAAARDFTDIIEEYLGQVFAYKNSLEGGRRDSLFTSDGIIAQKVFDKKWADIDGELLADGRIIFSHPNKELENDLNNKIAKRFNYAARVLGIVMGTDTVRAAKLLYDRYKNNFNSKENASEGYEDFHRKMSPREWDGSGSGKNPSSSAAGHGQFTKGTFLDMAKKYRPDLLKGKTEDEVLALRYNKAVTKELGEHLWRENRQYLQDKGFPVNNRNDYLAWFAGAPTASKILASSLDTPIRDVVSEDQYNANKAVFNKHPTVGDILKWAANGM